MRHACCQRRMRGVPGSPGRRSRGSRAPARATLGSEVYVDPEAPRHETVAFAAGTQTESVRMRTEELCGGQQATTVPLARQADRGSDDPVGRRRAAQQNVAGGGPPAP
jgi:hypothetical protein